MIEGGPTDSIDDYEHAAAAIQRYVGHVIDAPANFAAGALEADLARSYDAGRYRLMLDAVRLFGFESPDDPAARTVTELAAAYKPALLSDLRRRAHALLDSFAFGDGRAAGRVRRDVLHDADRRDLLRISSRSWRWPCRPTS